MNSRLKWEKFWYSDWLSDMNLQRATIEVRGAWINTLCVMWHDGTFEITESLEGWARVWGCTSTTAERIKLSFSSNKICDFYDDGNGNVTLVCRRLKREVKERQNLKNRVRAFRLKAECNAHVTPDVTVDVTPNVTPHVTHRGLEAKRLRGPEEQEKKGTARSDGKPSLRADVPPELADLELYAEDQKLCDRWATLLPVWVKAYPGVDVVAEVRKANAWEVANPEKRKVNRPRFLTNWLSRAQDRPKFQPAPAVEKSQYEHIYGKES